MTFLFAIFLQHYNSTGGLKTWTVIVFWIYMKSIKTTVIWGIQIVHTLKTKSRWQVEYKVPVLFASVEAFNRRYDFSFNCLLLKIDKSGKKKNVVNNLIKLKKKKLQPMKTCKLDCEFKRYFRMEYRTTGSTRIMNNGLLFVSKNVSENALHARNKI